MKFWQTILIVLGLLLLSIAVNLHIRKDPFLPNHGDEWEGLIFAREMQKQHRFVFSDATIASISEVLHSKLEMNYYLFILSALNLSSIDLLLLPFLLSVLTGFLLSLSAFVLVREFTKNNLAAFISAVFVLGFKSNPALSGYVFMVPAAFGISMVPLLVFLFLKGLESKRYFILFSIIAVNIFFTHPVYAVVIAPAAAVFLLLRPKLFMKNLALLFAVALFILVAGFVALKNISLENISAVIVKLFVFPMDIYTRDYPIIGFLNQIELLLIVAGLLLLILFSFYGLGFFKRFSARLGELLKLDFKPELNFAVFVFVFALIWLAIKRDADLYGVCFFGPCRRTMGAFVILLLVAAAIGFFLLYKILMEIILNAKGYAGKAMDVIAAAVLSALLFQYVLLSGFQYQNEMYNIIDKKQLSDLEWIKKLPEKSVVFAPEFVPKAIFLLSEKSFPEIVNVSGEGIYFLTEKFNDYYNYSLIAVELDPLYNVGFREKNAPQEIGYFLKRDCRQQKTILNKYKISHAYWLDASPCFLSDRIFDGGFWNVSKFSG